MTRFFDYWLKGIYNGVMDEPPLTIFRCEYTPPEAFPAHFNGEWHSEPACPIVERAYVGEAYTRPTPEALEALGLVARREGLVLDPACTSEATAGLIDLIRRRHWRAGERVVFLRTGGAPALRACEEVMHP